MSPGTVVSPAWSQCCRRILPSRGCLVSWAPLPALPRRELLLSELTTSNKFPILFVFETGVKNQAVLCHVTGDKPHGRGGAMCTTCCRVPHSGLREEQGPLHHPGVWDILWLLPFQSPGIFIHFHLEWGQKMSSHLQAVDCILFQQDKFHLRLSCSCWLWDLRTLTGHGRLPHNRPTKEFSPGQLPDRKKPVKMPNCFVLTKSVIPGAERGPVATQDQPQAPCQLHHPPWQGDVLESSMQTPSGSWLGAHGDPCSFLSQHLQTWGSE